MKKEINIQTTENGLNYFNIYEVRVQINGTKEVLTHERYLSKKEAENTLEIVIKFQRQYSKAWIREQKVWC